MNSFPVFTAPTVTSLRNDVYRLTRPIRLQRCSFRPPSMAPIRCTMATLSETKKKKSGGSTSPLQYRNLGDSDLVISEITMGTMPFGEQNTEKESHEILDYAFERGINAYDTAEMVLYHNPQISYTKKGY
ncbi:hypothetical protein ZOSMA_239G00310 [Zostera marina]|uniref:NADP-dependent oxidoreductase domain-containing protein n=1 Tax=Zostera marina TaxID=29655 RepID=A0A0K9PJV8_ZOSMR|nr:hypothetical protein ZOSMA_239G00310 [Zostera marina]